MGNCIVPQAKAKAILEYKPPIKVLSEFKSHAAISDSPAKKKKVKFADQVEEEEVVGQQVMRIKLVISKQELKSMLSGEGISLSDIIVCHLKNEGKWTDQINRNDNVDDDDDEVFSKGWKPMLDSIPEIIDYAA
ncbi:PREDICTED: uncharacterized protein LOC109192456 [Ipomoea nil]|uniref:uncharacterized protein LOC109192456 n=1 Tax=Ipomoea nil TaxID=35883 RepID=UPI000901F183|nr:PREDICTED: uncharacterized protein LOC109192456 [Ipomoea nil]